MGRSLKDAIKHRRTIYSLSNQSPISNKEIKDIIDWSVLHTPTAFNSQTGRVVLLLGDNHKKLWQITKDVLKPIINSAEAFKSTEAKIDGYFASGYGTVLFFEDQDVIKNLQEQYAAYAANFPLWSLQSSGILQYNVWTMFADIGLGASLQHYNPLIDEKVAAEWNIPSSWKLMSQMPFGSPLQEAGDKEFSPLEKRILVFK